MVPILAAMMILAQPPTPAAAPPAATVSQPSNRTVRADFRFAGIGRRRPVPYETARSLLLVRGTVAGRSAWILLDTGAGRTIVDAELARDAGLRIDPARIAIATPSGALAGSRVYDLDIAIADQLAVSLSQAGSADLRPVSTLLGRPVGAVLGWDILGRIAFLVDPSGPSLSVAPSGLLPPPAGARWVELSDRGRIPVGVGGARLSLFVDLGSSHVLGLRADIWERLTPKGTQTRPWNVSHAQGQSEASRLGMLPEIMLGSTPVRDIATVIETPRQGDGDGHVGIGLLSPLVFMLDAGQGRLWFAAPPTPRLDAGR